jgi:ABC-type glutathione transport system ATPase component
LAFSPALRPKVLLFDEPTSALDTELVGEVLDVIKELARSATTLVVGTHEIGFVREVADTMVCVEEGRILEIGAPEKIFHRPDHPRTAEFPAKVLCPPKSRLLSPRSLRAGGGHPRAEIPCLSSKPWPSAFSLFQPLPPNPISRPNSRAGS